MVRARELKQTDLDVQQEDRIKPSGIAQYRPRADRIGSALIGRRVASL
jgi:hypothetical protein